MFYLVKLWNEITILFLLILLLSSTVPASADRDRCMEWERLSNPQSPEMHYLTKENLHTRCAKNSLCSGIDCSGKYSTKGTTAFLPDYEMPYCFGLAMLPCQKPIKLFFYAILPSHQVSVNQTISNTSTFFLFEENMPVPPVKFRTYMSVDMKEQHRLSDGSRSAVIGASTDTYSVLFGQEMRIPGMHVVMLHDVMVTIPNCERSLKSTPVPPSINQCNASVAIDMHTPAVPVPTLPSVFCATAKCKMDTIGSCPANQVCEDECCKCVFGRNSSGSGCLEGQRKDTFITDGEMFKPKDASSHSVYFAIGGAFVGLAVLAVLAVIAVNALRRRRRRYGGHRRLAGDEQSTGLLDDEPLHGRGTGLLDDEPVHGRGTGLLDDEPVHGRGTGLLDDEPVHGRGTGLLDDEPVHGRGTGLLDDADDVPPIFSDPETLPGSC